MVSRASTVVLRTLAPVPRIVDSRAEVRSVHIHHERVDVVDDADHVNVDDHVNGFCPVRSRRGVARPGVVRVPFPSHETVPPLIQGHMPEVGDPHVPA